MSYLWHLDGLSMALGIGELDGCTRSWNTKCHSIFFLNTRFFWTRYSPKAHWPQGGNNADNTNIFFAHGTHFFAHGSHGSRILSLRLVVNDSSLWLLTRCGCWLVVVVDSLWLLTHCGYWLVVVIGLLWLLTCYVLNDKSKKISVSHAKHWQIREICEIRVLKKIRVIRVITSLRSVGLRRISCSKWWVVQDDEWFICGKWIHVIGVTHVC